MTQVGARFNRQPAHVVIVDISQPFNHDALVNVYQSLTDFFSLVTHINGPSRVPLFGLTIIGQYAETIFSLQPIKGNFPRLYSVLTEFKRSAMDVPMPMFEPESLNQGLKDVMSQYQRQQQTFRQVTNSPCQLEISIISCQPPQSLSDQICKLTETLNLNCLKKVQVLSLKVPESLRNEINSSISPPDNGSDQFNEKFAGIVDIVPLENDVLCMMNFFKGWLKDCGTDCESLHLILPSRLKCSPDLLDDNFGENTNEMMLKCDLHEALIDPFTLMNGEYFNLWCDYSFLKGYSHSSKAGNASQYVNKVYKLRAFCLVKTSGICESVLYGMPMFVRPTCCWKLDWDELESNQQRFNALCKVLNEKDLSLILKSETGEGSPQTFPHAYYLVMASSNSTLLIKSIVMEELMLPSNFPSLSEKTSQESTEVIEDSLDLLPVQDVYNPFFMKSNLFQYYIFKTIKNQPASRGNKRKYQVPQKAHEEYSGRTNPGSNRSNQSTAGRLTGKKVSFQTPCPTTARNPASNNSRNAGTSAQRRSRALPTVAIFEPSHKLYQ